MTSAARVFRRKPRTEAAVARRRHAARVAVRTALAGTAVVFAALAGSAAVTYVRTFPEADQPPAAADVTAGDAANLQPASNADPLADLPAAAEFTADDFLAAAPSSTSPADDSVAAAGSTLPTATVPASVEIDQTLTLAPVAASHTGTVRLLGSDVLASALPRLEGLLTGTPYTADVVADRPAIALARAVTESVVERQTPPPPTTTTLPPVPVNTAAPADTTAVTAAETTTTSSTTTTTTIPLAELSPETVVVVAGEHDFDPDVFSRSIDAVLAAAAPGDKVIVLTTTGQNATVMNSTLPGLRATHQNMLIADWAEFSAGHDEWFTTAPELSVSGTEAFALFVVAALFDPGVAA